MDQAINAVKKALSHQNDKTKGLQIRSIFLFSFISLTILSITLFYIIIINSISDNLDKNEKLELRTYADIILEDLESLTASLTTLAADYSAWDEAYQSSIESNTAFFEKNYYDWLPSNQDVDLLLVLDSKQNVLTSYGVATEVVKADRWMKLAIENNLKNRYEEIKEPYKGSLIRIGGRLYCVGVHPIVKQDLMSPSAGVVIFGRQIDNEYLKTLSDYYKYKISISLPDGSNFGELSKNEIEQYRNEGSQPTRDKDGYTLISSSLNDSLDVKVADLIIGSSNNEYSQLFSSINKYVAVGSFILLVTIVVYCLLLSRLITSPLQIFERKINEMVEKGRLEHLDIKATSEINTVTAAFNSLIETIHNKDMDIEMKDRFLAIVSHEFKTPITIINAATQAMNLICKDDITPKLAGYIDKINRNSLRQLRLVDNLLDITSIKAGQIKIIRRNVDIVSLTKEIIESVRLYALQKEIELNFSASFKKKIISMDEQKYERIVLNLVSNAIKFTPAGKSVDVRLSSKGGLLKLEVIDTGIGIPLEKQDLIFERFGQVDSSLSRQAEGTGIGLYLVKSFVTILGGRVSLVSREGVGSNFSVYLPMVNDTNLSFEENSHRDKIEYATSLEFSDIIL